MILSLMVVILNRPHGFLISFFSLEMWVQIHFHSHEFDLGYPAFLGAG